jgi:hypothetical protein
MNYMIVACSKFISLRGNRRGRHLFQTLKDDALCLNVIRRSHNLKVLTSSTERQPSIMLWVHFLNILSTERCLVSIILVVVDRLAEVLALQLRRSLIRAESPH